MTTKDLKYFLAFIPSIAALLGLWAGGGWTYSAVVIAFIIVPVLEFVFTGDGINFPATQEVQRREIRFFDYILYSNVLVLYAVVGFYFYQLTYGGFSLSEVIGATASVAVINGTVGINVAHELGHRNTKLEQFLARCLLLPSMYMHFTIEHNLGHHKHVATPRDPSTARKGEMLYAFWFRSTWGCYLGAWKLEKTRLSRAGISFGSIENQMIRFQIIQLVYLLVLGIIFGWSIIPFALFIAIGGFILLETVNYIEHYGLLRNQSDAGVYETVKPNHSWNSDHHVGRILLYELTRHADHHYKANRPYQILKHIEDGPQLPMGYPGSMLMSLVPPLWFYVMNKRLAKFQKLEA